MKLHKIIRDFWASFGRTFQSMEKTQRLPEDKIFHFLIQNYIRKTIKQ